MRYIYAIICCVTISFTAYAGDEKGNDEFDREILEQLKQRRLLLEAKVRPQVVRSDPSARAVTIDVGAAPFLGAKNAPATIVEFTDFECPYCEEFHNQTFPELRARYIDTGRVRFYSLDLPLPMHPDALTAAQAGRCAEEQGLFWAMRDKMQRNPNKLKMSDLTGYAKDSGLDVSKFRLCVEMGRFKDDIQRQVQEAQAKGASGTPTFVIGKSTASGVDGELIVGAIGREVFDQKLSTLK